MDETETKELPDIQIVDSNTGEPADMSVLQDAGVAYDPARMPLDLSKEEKRRTTALMLAMQAYKSLLIPDAPYLEKAADLARRGEGPKIQPATIDAMVVAAVKFDFFIAHGQRLMLPEGHEIEGRQSPPQADVVD